jgi:hypothetical protein
MWICNARGKTGNAHKMPLPQTFGPTQDHAAKQMKEKYEQRVKPRSGQRQFSRPGPMGTVPSPQVFACFIARA